MVLKNTRSVFWKPENSSGIRNFSMIISKPNENTWNIFIRFSLREAIYCADNTAG